MLHSACFFAPLTLPPPPCPPAAAWTTHADAQVRKGGQTVDEVYEKWSEVVVDIAYNDWSSEVLTQYVQSDGVIGIESSES